MNFFRITICGGIIVTTLLAITSCTQLRNANNTRILNEMESTAISSRGYTIENGFRRGTQYTDSTGRLLNMRYTPVSIQNDTTVNLHFEMTFPRSFTTLDHPDFNAHFRAFLLPENWADTSSISPGMLADLGDLIAHPHQSKTLTPGEKWIFALGVVYANPPTCGVIPNGLFNQSEYSNSENCTFLPHGPSGGNTSLLIQLDYCSQCVLFTGGKVSYGE